MGRKNNAAQAGKKGTNQKEVVNSSNVNKKVENKSDAQVNGSVDNTKEIDQTNGTFEDHKEANNNSSLKGNKQRKGKENVGENEGIGKEGSKKIVTPGEGNNNKENVEEVKRDLKKEMKLKEDERKKVEKELLNTFEKLVDISRIADVRERIEEEGKQRKKIEGLISSINSAISKATSQTSKPTNMKWTSADVESKLKEAKMKKKKINVKNVEEIAEANTYISYLEEQLSITKNYESLKTFQSRLNNLKKLCEEKIKDNEKSIGDEKQQQRKLRAVERIIKTKKEKQNIDVEEIDIITKEYLMPIDHHNSIVKPHNFFNRIIVKHFVYVEKEMIPNAEKICLRVMGCPDDVDNFINHLKNINFAEKNSAHVGFQVIKNMLAMYEGSFRSMEIDNNVFVQADKDMIYYCGMKQDVEKFKEVMNKAKIMYEKNSSSKALSKSIKLDSVLARGFNRAILKDIENNTSTFIKINYDEKKDEAVAIIKGNKNTEMEEAEEKLNKIFESLDVHFMEFEENMLMSLYRKCKYDLNDIRNQLGLFIIRHRNGISLVGKRENIDKAIDIINNAKNSILSKTVRKKLTDEESYLFNANYRNYIKNETGATVKIFNKNDYKELHISGTAENIDSAISIIENLLENKKCVEVEISEKTVAFLLSGKAQKIKEIEVDTSTSIQINKNERVAQIYGHEDKIHLAKDILEQLVLDEKEGAAGNYNTKETYEEVLELVVDTDNIGSIIGRRGQTINKIQEESYVSKIHVDKDKRKVYIYGSKKAVAIAKEKVLEIVKRTKNQEAHGERSGDRYGRNMKGSDNYGGTPYKKTNRSTGSKSGRSSSKPEGSKNGVYINTNDEEAFPSLHDTVLTPQKKGKKNASQSIAKKQDEVGQNHEE